jgi:hypothetical protein
MLKFSQNLHGLKAVLQTIFLHTKKCECIFEPLSKAFIGMRQMTQHWKVAANLLISHIESFPKFQTVKEQFVKSRNF